MTHAYQTLFLLLAALPAAGQTILPPDTTRPPLPFRGLLPDSLATAPTPGGTFRLQGQEQPSRPFLTVQDQLRTVAGVQVTPYDGAPGSGQVVRIRGASVAQGLAQPLYVIDGLPALNDDLTPGQALGVLPAQSPQASSTNYRFTTAEQNQEVGASPLQLLPPESIESIEVLSGPAAVARYGPLAANGVVSIRTRRAATGAAPHLRYTAYAGLQQVRQRYDLLDAGQYAAVANEATSNRSGSTVASPYPNPNLGQGTDWQAETYRLAALQQHQLSYSGSHGGTTYVVSADYRQQSGVLHGSDLTRLGLRLALGQAVGRHLQLQGTVALGQTQQRLPHTQSGISATRAALFAPPTQPVRNAQGNYNGYDAPSSSLGPVTQFPNPLLVADYFYRDPRTRRLLTQLGATYTPLPGLRVEASGNFQRTLLSADSYQPLYQYLSPGQPVGVPTEAFGYNTQSYQASSWASQLALHYQRPLGRRHLVGAELDYQYQATNFNSRTDTQYPTPPGSLGGYSYYRLGGETRLHRPWARLHYTLDSTLTLEAGLSYSHYKGLDGTQYYPSAQLSWHTSARAQLATRLWAGLARTSTFGQGGTIFLPFQSGSILSPGGYAALAQPSFSVTQAEAGLRLSSRSGHLTGQLVAYQRRSAHSVFVETFSVPSGSNLANTVSTLAEASLRNQGLELTLTARWQRGRLQGSTRLAGSLNRNRLSTEAIARQSLEPVVSDAATGSFYGFQQAGLTATGTLRFAPDATTGGYQQAVLGQGIPPQLASFSQQLRLGRLALDMQVDGMFGYQVLNYQLSYLDTPTGYTNSATTALDRWTPTHQNTTIPVAGSAANFLAFGGVTPQASYLIESASNVRLSSLTLTYRLRQTATQDISVWVGGQNLFVLTSYRGYDPNVSSGGATPSQAGLDYGAVPVPRTWLLGVSAGF
jgi:hypothetical protein